MDTSWRAWLECNGGITPACTKLEGPSQSDLESQAELKKTEEELHLQWLPIKTTQRVVDQTLCIYQHGQQPKTGSSSKPCPPPTVKNPWDKEFTPKDFPTAHKVHSTLPKQWKLHEGSPIMLKPPASSAVEQVLDTEINMYYSWLDTFVTRASHTASLSSTALEASYNFLQKVIMVLRSSVAHGNIKDAPPTIDKLLQRVNSTVLEAQLMSNDATVTTTELYAHLHMLQHRSVLEFSAVDLPQETSTVSLSWLLEETICSGLTPERSRNGRKALRWNQLYSSPQLFTSSPKPRRSLLPLLHPGQPCTSRTSHHWMLFHPLGPGTLIAKNLDNLIAGTLTRTLDLSPRKSSLPPAVRDNRTDPLPVGGNLHVTSPSGENFSHNFQKFSGKHPKEF